jgi:hypothetical protein
MITSCYVRKKDQCPKCGADGWKYNSYNDKYECNSCGYKQLQGIPPAWYWANHRIPSCLRSIEQGRRCPDIYIQLWLRKILPNYVELMAYYEKQYGCCVK